MDPRRGAYFLRLEESGRIFIQGKAEQGSGSTTLGRSDSPTGSPQPTRTAKSRNPAAPRHEASLPPKEVFLWEEKSWLRPQGPGEAGDGPPCCPK